MKRRLIVVDNFYQEPKEIRVALLASKYQEPSGARGRRSPPYIACGTRERIERAIRTKITKWSTKGSYYYTNGVFFISLSKGNQAEPVMVHFDEPATNLTGLVYLTPRAPSDSGTSFWRHRPTGLEAKPNHEDARRLGVTCRKLEYRLDQDSDKSECWEEIDRVENVFNRAVFFSAGLLHSATRHFGGSLLNGRIYQSFHFEVQDAGRESDASQHKLDSLRRLKKGED
jgi:hypothetical protein